MKRKIVGSATFLVDGYLEEELAETSLEIAKRSHELTKQYGNLFMKSCLEGFEMGVIFSTVELSDEEVENWFCLFQNEEESKAHDCLSFYFDKISYRDHKSSVREVVWGERDSYTFVTEEQDTLSFDFHRTTIIYSDQEVIEVDSEKLLRWFPEFQN